MHQNFSYKVDFAFESFLYEFDRIFLNFSPQAISRMRSSCFQILEFIFHRFYCLSRISLKCEGTVFRYSTSSFSVFSSFANLFLGCKGTVLKYSSLSFNFLSNLASLSLGCEGTVLKYSSSSFNVFSSLARCEEVVFKYSTSSYSFLKAFFDFVDGSSFNFLDLFFFHS